MNKNINKFLLAGDKSMSEMYLRQTGFRYNTCGPFTKNKERIKKFKKTVDLRYIYQSELDKACSPHDIDYEHFKDLPRRTAVDKVLRGKSRNLKYDRYQRGFASMVYRFSDKKTSLGTVKNEIMPNQHLAEELHKPIIRKFEKGKVHSSFTYNIWGADRDDMQLSKLNKGFRFLLCVIDIYTKYAWVFPLKNK